MRERVNDHGETEEKRRIGLKGEKEGKRAAEIAIITTDNLYVTDQRVCEQQFWIVMTGMSRNMTAWQLEYY